MNKEVMEEIIKHNFIPDLFQNYNKQSLHHVLRLIKEEVNTTQLNKYGTILFPFENVIDRYHQELNRKFSSLKKQQNENTIYFMIIVQHYIISFFNSESDITSSSNRRIFLALIIAIIEALHHHNQKLSLYKKKKFYSQLNRIF
jgi:hypothetical protein